MNEMNSVKSGLPEVKDNYAHDILETVREPMLVLDETLRALSANFSFYNHFRVSEAEIRGKSIFDLGNRQWDVPQLRLLLENILPKNSFFDDFEMTVDLEHIGVGPCF
jgi:PAS domain-containing protein